MLKRNIKKAMLSARPQIPTTWFPHRNILTQACQWPRTLVSLAIALSLMGCTSIGPNQMNLDRGRYNDVVSETDQVQLLKNIVRIRYAQPVSFMKVTNVTSSYTLTSGVSTDSGTPIGSFTSNHAGSRASPSSNTTWAGGIFPSVSYSDSPTLSYVPVADATFITALQSPLTFNDFILLYRGGIRNLDLVSRIAFMNVDDLDNASFASGIGQQVGDYDYKNYLRFSEALINASRLREIEIIPISLNKGYAMMIHFNTNSTSPNIRLIKQLLHMPSTTNDIVLVDRGLVEPIVEHNGVISLDTRKQAKNVVYVQFRSILGIMIFLSHAVEVPQADINAHLVYQAVDANGRPFDWTPLLSGIMDIHYSDNEPLNAFVKTKFNNHWFYISNSDLQSKTTFTLLIRLMTLTTGGHGSSPQSSPVLTIPVK